MLLIPGQMSPKGTDPAGTFLAIFFFVRVSANDCSPRLCFGADAFVSGKPR